VADLQNIMNTTLPPSILYTSAAVNDLFAHALLFTAIIIPTIQFFLCNRDHNMHYAEMERNSNFKISKRVLEKEFAISASLYGSKEKRPVFLWKINKTSVPKKFFQLCKALLKEIEEIADHSIESYFWSCKIRDLLVDVIEKQKSDVKLQFKGANAIIQLPGDEAEFTVYHSDIFTEVQRSKGALALKNAISVDLANVFKERVKSKLTSLNDGYNKFLMNLYSIAIGSDRSQIFNLENVNSIKVCYLILYDAYFIISKILGSSP
jgi:hypothetical protein